jgi:L-2-hydroxyglutarate oxidase
MKHGEAGIMNSPDREADVAIVGGGIVGLASAYQIGRRAPGTRVVVVEKEDRVAAHQTGHNSGVIHSGIYYRPGSQKATNCRRGKGLLEQFCREHGVPFETCGKVVVAVTPAEVPRLRAIAAPAAANGVSCALVGPERLRELEPHAHGLLALHVPETGIVDYRAVCRILATLVSASGGEVLLSARVVALHERPDGLPRPQAAHPGQVAVNAPAFTDRVLALTREPRDVRIVPFRGEYYELRPPARPLVRNLIYPVPDPAFPFLGVHFTRTIQGGVECGPNAVLALAREGYRWSDVDLRDLADSLGYPGLWRLACRYWRTGAGEVWRSLSKAAFTRALQRLLPEIRGEHLEAAPAGVRAQALAADGSLVDDFHIRERGRMVHVLNAPSPAATASLAIGEAIAGHALRRLSSQARP